MTDRIQRPTHIPHGYDLHLDTDPTTGDALPWFWEGRPTETAELTASVIIDHDDQQRHSIHLDLEPGDYTLDELALNLRALADLYKKARHDLSTPTPAKDTQ